eukprot:7677701-Lingulodinium_polyedra.AAC.1
MAQLNATFALVEAKKKHDAGSAPCHRTDIHFASGWRGARPAVNKVLGVCAGVCRHASATATCSASAATAS